MPAVVQDTGFGSRIPAGDGVLAFTNLDGAADAICRIADEPERHSAAARAVAERHFGISTRAVSFDWLTRMKRMPWQHEPRHEYAVEWVDGG